MDQIQKNPSPDSRSPPSLNNNTQYLTSFRIFITGRLPTLLCTHVLNTADQRPGTDCTLPTWDACCVQHQADDDDMWNGNDSDNLSKAKRSKRHEVTMQTDCAPACAARYNDALILHVNYVHTACHGQRLGKILKMLCLLSLSVYCRDAFPILSWKPAPTATCCDQFPHSPPPLVSTAKMQRAATAKFLKAIYPRACTG